MSFINSILKAFVGDKSQKDVKALQPYLAKIKALESSLSDISNDELRAKTNFFKEKIKQARSEKDVKIEALKKTEFEKGVFKGRNQLYNISTKKSQNLVDKNYPYWNKKID